VLLVREVSKLLLPGVSQQNKLTAAECKYVTKSINGVSTNRVKKKFHKKNNRGKFHLKQNVFTIDRHL